MKAKVIALAVAALSAGTSHAYTDDASNLYLTGASAIRNNVAAAVRSMCAEANGTLTVFKQGSSISSLANQMAYVCSAGMAGTGITTVFHTTTGGSLNAILGMSADPAKQQQPVSLTSGCTAAVAGTGALAGYMVRPSCNPAAVAASDGGISDVEYGPAIEQVSGLSVGTDGFTLADVVPGFTGVAQAFGIAVNEKMYKGLQTAQGLASCGVGLGDPTPACQPSLSRADIASLINNNIFAPQKNGAEALGLTAGATIEYARRPTVSGTQITAQLYFLGKGCLNGPNVGEFDIIAPGNYNGGRFVVSNNSGTGDVLARLNSTTNYVFGVVSAENRAPTGITGWRYVKLNGVAISDGTGTGMNKANAINGSYDFFVEAAAYTGPNTDAAEQAVFTAITDKMSLPVAMGGSATVGLFIIPDNGGGFSNAGYPTEVGKFQRGGAVPNSCQPISRPF